MTLLLAAAIGAIIATFTTLLIARKYYNDLADYLDELNVAQEDDATRANRLHLDLEHTKERINADLVQHNKRLGNLHGRVTKLELQKDHSS